MVKDKLKTVRMTLDVVRICLDVFVIVYILKKVERGGNVDEHAY